MEPCETQRKEYEQCLKPYKSDLDAYKLFFCETEQKSFLSCKEFNKWVLKTVTENMRVEKLSTELSKLNPDNTKKDNA